jgi:hypothetical protein
VLLSAYGIWMDRGCRMADGYIREANTGIGMVHEGVGDAG